MNEIIYFQNEMDTSLHSACHKDNIEMDKLLLAKKGIDFNFGNTPLHYACSHGYIKVFKCLIEHGANVKNTENQTPFDIVNRFC